MTMVQIASSSDWNCRIFKREDSTRMKTLRFNGSLLRNCDTAHKLRNISTSSYLISSPLPEVVFSNAQVQFIDCEMLKLNAQQK